MSNSVDFRNCLQCREWAWVAPMFWQRATSGLGPGGQRSVWRFPGRLLLHVRRLFAPCLYFLDVLYWRRAGLVYPPRQRLLVDPGTGLPRHPGKPYSGLFSLNPGRCIRLCTVSALPAAARVS